MVERWYSFNHDWTYKNWTFLFKNDLRRKYYIGLFVTLLKYIYFKIQLETYIGIVQWSVFPCVTDIFDSVLRSMFTYSSHLSQSHHNQKEN